MDERKVDLKVFEKVLKMHGCLGGLLDGCDDGCLLGFLDGCIVGTREGVVTWFGLRM